MSEPQNKERMNSIFQEAKRRELPDAEPGVNSRGAFTLTWLVGTTEIVIVLNPALYLTVTKEDGNMAIDFNLAGKTDTEVVDRVVKELYKASATR